MSLKSGWCMDEIQYRDLGESGYADHLHDQCPYWLSGGTCPCPGHGDGDPS